MNAPYMTTESTGHCNIGDEGDILNDTIHAIRDEIVGILMEKKKQRKLDICVNN